jgi:hypothetical protein
MISHIHLISGGMHTAADSKRCVFGVDFLLVIFEGLGGYLEGTFGTMLAYVGLNAEITKHSQWY